MGRFSEALFAANGGKVSIVTVGPLTVETFPLEGLKLITSKTFPDDRGFFCERFKTSDFHAAGLPTHFKQDNFSTSKANILRGLHYQWEQPQGKLVTCTRGKIFDVAVDVRASSPTFGKHISVELSGDLPQWFWIPAGFAHGFQVLGNSEADVLYKCDNEYNGKAEGGIRFDDSDLKIPWLGGQPQVSVRDQQMQSFSEYKKAPRF